MGEDEHGAEGLTRRVRFGRRKQRKGLCGGVGVDERKTLRQWFIQ
jgi:hypothetical protein